MASNAGTVERGSVGGWRRPALAALLLVLLALLAAWFLGWLAPGVDPRVREIQTMQESLRRKFQSGGGPANLMEATETVAAMAEIRQRIDALPEDVRAQVDRSGGNSFRAAFRARIDAYFNLPPEKRQAELDRQIDQEEWMRKAFEAGNAVASVFGGGTASGRGDAGGSWRGGPPRGGSDEERNRWRKGMIDRTTPEQRARYVEYRRAMDERRQQRGLPGRDR